MKDYKYVYLLGIGGIGMSALARWFNAQSIPVFGYDRASSALTDQLIQEGIRIHFEDCPEAVPTQIITHKAHSLVVYTPAISPHNSILNHLIGGNYVVRKRAEVVGMLTQSHRVLAVAGTHGKTTTTTLLAHILYQAKKHVAAFLGGIAKGYASNLLVNGPIHRDTMMVIEADEFDRFFLQLRPYGAIVTNIDPDHLDTYGDVQGLQEAFKTFITSVSPAGKAIIHQKVAQQLRIGKTYPNVIDYALTDATIRAENLLIKEGHYYFDYVSEETTIRNLQLTIPGYHNVENALAVITVCLAVGLDAEEIRRGMASFQGVKRRFDYVIRNDKFILLDDYAHHPVEITALLKTIRTLYPDKNVTAIFRPNLYTRTRDLAEEFAKSLDLADQAFLLDIYPDREAPIEGVTTACIFDRMTLSKKWMCSIEDVFTTLRQEEQPDIIVIIGSGGTSSLVTLTRQFALEHWG